MIASKNLYIQLVFRVVLITLTALLIGFLFIKEYYILCVLALCIIGIETLFLIKYVNQTNRRIAYFFDSIKNEDFTMRFPEAIKNKTIKELNSSLNTFNSKIQEVYLKNQSQEQFYQEILKQADIGILTFNTKGHILFANPTVEKLLNYTPLNHIKQLQQIDYKLYNLFVNLKPFERTLFELTNEREKRQLALKSTAISLNKQSLLLVVIQDIHKELDEKETDSWVRLIRVLTHEIMNTVAPITSISESILKYFKKEEDIIALNEFKVAHLNNTAKGLEVIKDQGQNLMSFVQSYRSFLNVPKPDKEIVLAQKLLDRVTILMTEDTKVRAVSFEVISFPEDLELFIDEKQLTQVLLNLCKNAYQSLENQKNGIIKITAGVNNEGNKYIEVWDNGPGIPKELQEEIFVPFFTTKSTGTGIGLSLSKQILRLHGGTLKVTSIPNKETRFLMIFN